MSKQSQVPEFSPASVKAQQTIPNPPPPCLGQQRQCPLICASKEPAGSQSPGSHSYHVTPEFTESL